MSTVFKTHAEFEAQNPNELSYARQMEASRRERYALAHDGSTDGYQPVREFPCIGVLRTIETARNFDVVRCSICGFEGAVKRDETTARF